MPARWQSSERPLFVRTVWVDGAHHAILSPDDPALRCRPGSCPTVHHTAPAPPMKNDLGPCVLQLRVVVEQQQTSPDVPPPLSTAAPRCRRRCRPRYHHYHHYHHQEALQGPSVMVGCYGRPYMLQPPPTSSDEEDENAGYEDDSWFVSEVESLLQLNPLSERVLQWMDLAGRASEQCPPPPPPLQAPEPPQWKRARRRGGGGLTSAPVALRRNSGERRLLRAVSQDSSSTPTVPLSVSAQGLRTRRPYVDPPPLSSPSPEQETPPPTPPVVTPPATPEVPVKEQPGGCRPQLHIFMPALPRDCSASECESCWGDAWRHVNNSRPISI